MIIKCDECKVEISSQAKICPKCGKPQDFSIRPITMDNVVAIRAIFWGIVLAILFVSLFLSCERII